MTWTQLSIISPKSGSAWTPNVNAAPGFENCWPKRTLSNTLRVKNSKLRSCLYRTQCATIAGIRQLLSGRIGNWSCKLHATGKTLSCICLLCLFLILWPAGIAASQYSHVKYFTNQDAYSEYYYFVFDKCDIGVESVATHAQTMLVDHLREHYGNGSCRAPHPPPPFRDAGGIPALQKSSVSLPRSCRPLHRPSLVMMTFRLRYGLLNRRVSLDFDQAVRRTNPVPGGRGNPAGQRHSLRSLSASQPLPLLHVQSQFPGVRQVSHLQYLRHRNGWKLPKSL